MDYYPKVDKQNCTKYWASKVDAFYYHLNIECLRKRIPNVLLRREDVKVSEGLTFTEKIKVKLFDKILDVANLTKPERGDSFNSLISPYILFRADISFV